MGTAVNLDALIPREDFEVKGDRDELSQKQSIQITNLERRDFFYGALRKPDFQRETAEWDAKKIVGLIRTFINGDLIPGVILWQNRELLFVIDGSHRLSALIAWVQNDYGDGKLSQEFFNYQIPEEQMKAAQQARLLAEKEFGSYAHHVDAIEHPESYGPDVVARARRFGSLSLQLQWVKGDGKKAEDSFIRINQQAVNITPQELDLIKDRRKPTAIAARAIIRRATGHKYWSSFDEAAQQLIGNVATDIYDLLFKPSLTYPIKSVDLPAGGGVYSSTALRMVYDLVTIANGAPGKDDTDGERTIAYLKRCHRTMQLILSNDPRSLGLHPAVYFYSWTGKQQPILFLTMAKLLVDFEQQKHLPYFTECRAEFEGFLIEYRTLTNQIIRKFGAKDPMGGKLRRFYEDVLAAIKRGLTSKAIIDELRKDETYAYLQPEESPYAGVSPTRYSTQVKSGLIISQLLPKEPRCAICRGAIPRQAISVDHIRRLQDGGASTIANAQLTHPYCNTGYKEADVAREQARLQGS